MLQHVWERAAQSRYLTHTVYRKPTTIASSVKRAASEPTSRMTREDHISGTDRVAEIASQDQAELIVNIQGDEPLIDPEAIDAALLPLVHEPAIVMGTLKKKIEDPRELFDANVVKVVTDRFENALYFSRSTLPFAREQEPVERF